jgi:metal-responsive CopG/Arc/MetJ family transcriptional regulator
MGVSEDKKQIPVILPKDIVDLLDEERKKEVRSRSSQAAKIIMDYYGRKEKEKE